MSRRFWAILGIGLVILQFLPIIAPNDPYQTGLRPAGEAPGVLIFGADMLGRDVFSRLLHGIFPTLGTGLLACLLAWTGGAALGFAAAASQVLLKQIAGIFTIALLALPSFFVALVIVTGLGAGMSTIAIAAGVAQIGVSSQVWQGVVWQITREPYLEAARAVGASRWGILWRHILPNALPVMLAYGCALYTASILMISSLTFLGLGGDLASPDWGTMMAEGRAAIRHAPHIMLAPAVALSLVTLGVNALGRRINSRG